MITHLQSGDIGGPRAEEIQSRGAHQLALLTNMQACYVCVQPVMCVCLCLWQVDLHETESVHHVFLQFRCLADELPSPTIRWGSRSVEGSSNTIYFLVKWTFCCRLWTNFRCKYMKTL